MDRRGQEQARAACAHACSDQGRGHHRQIRQHVVLAHHLPERLHSLRHRATSQHHVVIGASCGLVPVPGVFEGVDLRR